MNELEQSIARWNAVSGKALEICRQYHNQSINRAGWLEQLSAIFDNECDHNPAVIGWVMTRCEDLIAPIDWDFLAEYRGESLEREEEDIPNLKTTTLMPVPVNKLLVEHRTALVLLQCFDDWLKFPSFRHSDLGARASKALRDLQSAQAERDRRSIAWKNQIDRQLTASTETAKQLKEQQPHV